MTRRRRCCFCKELFQADPRVGARQRTCGRPECRAECHRQACREWRQREGVAVAEDRLRRRLGVSGSEVRLDVVRDEIGPKIKVVLEECLRLFSTGSRDEFQTKQVEQRRDRLRLVDRLPRDEIRNLGPVL